MNKVWQILKNKGGQVWTISQDATVLDALKLLAEKQIGALIVMDGEKVVGIFSERDHARKGVLIGKLPEVTKIAEVMTRDLITVNPDQSVNECMALMTERHIRHLPVFEGDKLVGLVSIGDIVKDMIEELEFMVNQLEKYITGVRGSP
jgi:CBS domain-containing protein